MPNPSLLQFSLSKSKFLAGLQCHKRLYFKIHSPELAAEIDEQAQARFETGRRVGKVARQRFPGGVLVEFDQYRSKEGLQYTAELLHDRNVPAIFEGAFEFDNVIVRPDILERVGENRWRLIEVKSSTKVKDEHFNDLAVQAYILNGAAVALAGSWLMPLNNQYVYQGGELHLEQLFALEDLTAEVGSRQAEIPSRLAAMGEMLGASLPPMITPDAHCHDPYTCEFWLNCTKDKPPRWIYHLPRIGKKFDRLRHQGIESIDDIPNGFTLSAPQQRMKDNIEWIGPGLKAELAAVRYPIHYLDFESLNPALPHYPGSRPYQQIPFQWSCHTESQDGHVRHAEYLCAAKKDPREELAKRLLQAVGTEGTICVYNASFERRILSELGHALPHFKSDLDRIIERLWDLEAIVSDHYYHPDFGGSLSLKDVLPALIPALEYSDLEVQDGETASLAYYRMIFEEIVPAEKERIRLALLEYCKRDTLAMLELRKALMARAGRGVWNPERTGPGGEPTSFAPEAPSR